MAKYILSLLILTLLGSTTLFGQKSDTLSANSEELFQQISTILQNTPSKTYQKKSEDLMERFHERWSIGRFNKVEKAEIRNLIEKMREKRMRTFPYLYDYIYSLTLIAESQQVPRSIIAWHAYASLLLDENKSTNFSNLLSFTSDLLENNRFFKTNGLSWYQRKTRFSFVLDTSFMVVFQKGDLIGATRKDTSIIVDTKGVFYYELKRWDGETGKLEWSRFGREKAKEIYADINNYTIDVTQSSYTIDSAVLHYKRFFGNPIVGKITERITSSPPTKKSTFPQFDAYFDEFELYNIYPDISFFGGAHLEGLSLYGTGGGKAKASLKLTKSDSLYAMVRAEKFRLNADEIISSNAEFVFYFQGDSLYHPSLRVKFSSKNSQFVMYTDNTGSNTIPFFDSYHELDIYVQAIFWKMGEPELIFKRIRNVKDRNIARFVSSNYFSQNDFYRLQGIDDINPLYVIQNYMKIYSDTEIKLNSLAAFMEKPVDQVSAMLIDLSNKGFIVYNSRKKMAVVKDRLLYFLDAKSGNTDYDVIQLTSSVDGRANAIIDLNTLDLEVNGVPNVSISDSQEVYIFPYDKTISFKKNRDFTFDGQVHMGLLDFYSRNSTFIYDSFLLRMNYVDSLAFKVYASDSLRVLDSLVKVKNVIVDMVGTIYIDQPQNKSGLRDYPEFPTFVSDDVSYVYFNKSNIQDSTLIPESFYYAVDPFTFDSISTFTTEGLSFEGNLVSAGIFPVIVEPLTVMPDYSLGFSHSTADAGYDLYGGLGKFTSLISLSNNGFKGNGGLGYLSSQSESDEFTFYPDSLTGVSDDFQVLESQVKYDFPYMQGDTVNIKWVIDTNVMTLTTDVGPFNLYDNSLLTGDVYLNPEYMRGDGLFKFDQSELLSNSIKFNYSKLTADTADFILRNIVNDSIVFSVTDYFAKIDFEKQMGWFNHVTDNSFVRFPYNNYISTLDEVEWQMTEEKLLLSSNLRENYIGLDTLNMLQLIDYKLKGPEFISVNTEQDSLRFFAGSATYNLIDYTIDVEKVKLIKVADAAIFPIDGKVQILRGANINTLGNALIITDTANKYHSIYDAEVNIFGRRQFTANGWVDYSDRNGTKQPIRLTSVSINDRGETSGFGQIAEEDIFFLSPEYFFRGDVSLLGSRKDLRFTGGYKLNEECVANLDNWVAFNQILNPKEIFFDVNDSTQDSEGKRAFFGLAYTDQYRRFYPLVIEPFNNPSDLLLLNATGQMRFDTASGAFSVGTASRYLNNTKQSNFVLLNNSKCIMSGDGNFDLGLDINMLTLKASGNFKHIIMVDSTYLDIVMLLDFYFDDKVLDMMTDSIRLTNNDGVSTSEGIFPDFIRKNLPVDESEKYITELNLYGQMRKVHEAIKHKLIFSDLKLYWDSYTRSYLSRGKIGLGYINGNAINSYIDGWVQIEKGRTGSSISIYLAPSEKTWYFFNYKNGIMQVISSDNSFNNRIETIKAEKRILNSDSDTDYYEYVISTRRKSIDFLRKMEKIKKN